jgi:hypothetical protein
MDPIVEVKLLAYYISERKRMGILTSLYMIYNIVSVISIIDYTLHQLLKSRGKKEAVQYSKIMILKPKHMSTPKQVRNNINGMIKRLQQRSKSSSPPQS